MDIIFSLTASGMRLKQRAQDLVELADRTEAEMKQKEEIIAGEISLGIGETVNMVFLSRVMRSPAGPLSRCRLFRLYGHC